MTSALARTEAPIAEPRRVSPTAARPLQMSVAVEVILLGALLLLAFGLRLPHLALVPHFTDETWEVLWSLPIVRGEGFPLTNFNVFKGALFNYLVAASFLVLGPSALAARLVVLVLGVLTVLATYALGRAWGGALAGLLAAALLATNPPHILFNSHIAWSNCITPLFTTLGVLTLYKALPRTSPAGQNRPFLVLSGLLWGMAFQTHPMVAGLLPGVAAYALLKGQHLLRTRWPYLAAVAFLVGCANLVAYNVINGPESLVDAQHVQRNYTTDEEAAESYPEALGAELLLLGRTLGGVVDERSPAWRYLLDLGVAVGILAMVAGVGRETLRGNPLPLILSSCFLVVLPAINPKFRAIIYSRYLMPLVPVLLAAIASLLTRHLRRRWTTPSARLSLSAAVAAALVLLLAPLPSLQRYYDRAVAGAETNERAYRLAQLVEQHRQPEEQVVFDEGFGYEVGWGTSELRAMRYLLTFQGAPVKVTKLTPRRLEDELEQGPSRLVVLNGRQLRDYDRLPLQPLTPLPQRLAEAGLFRLSDKGLPRRSAGN